MSNFIVDPYRFVSELPFSGDDDLKAYFKFNESSGSIINVSESSDTLGTGVNMTMDGGNYDVATTPSDIGTGVTFDGIEDFAICGTSTSAFNFMHNTSALWTLVWWMRLNEIGSDDTFLATKINTDGGTPGYSVRLQTGNKISTYIINGTALPLNTNSTANFIPDDTDWYFYTMSYDQSEADENLVRRRNNANEETADKAIPTPSDSNAGYPQNMAKRPDSAGDFGDFSVAELSQWNKVVSDEDQTALYNNGQGREIY